MSIRRTLGYAVIASLAIAATGAEAQDRAIILQSTTSTANSGLYDHILPRFEETSGIRVNVVAVGTGQAIRNARNCDGDVLLVHDTPSEEAFVADGSGTERTDVMFNDFVIVGPEADLAGIGGAADAASALSAISDAAAPFASRADESGTHKKEMALWSSAEVDPTGASGAWYLETGSGMGATLNTGIGLGAYILTDRATWVSFANKQDYAVLVEGDAALHNQYGVIPVNPDVCPNVDQAAARAFVDWLLSPDGQGAIASFRVDGQQLFFPNAPE